MKTKMKTQILVNGLTDEKKHQIFEVIFHDMHLSANLISQNNTSVKSQITDCANLPIRTQVSRTTF